MSDNKQLTELLDREFLELERAGKGPFPTVQKMAAHLGMDKASLSRYRSGDRLLTRKKAQLIASKLRTTKQSVQALAEQLFAAKPEVAAHQIEVLDWFEERKREGCLMAVEFRELPVVRPTGSKAHLAKAVAEAVAAGLNYPMFFPFHLGTPENSKIAAPLRSYLSDLRTHVINTYASRLENVLEHVHGEASEAEDNEALKKKLVDASKRLKLYTLNAGSMSACPAIGYRLFYVEEHEPANHGQTAPRGTAQRWEWVSLQERDQMVLKGSSQAELEATAIRFFPVVEYWRDCGELPQTSAEMANFAKRLEKDFYMTSLDLEVVHWSVFGEDRTPVAVVEDFLTRIASESATTSQS